MSLILVLLLVLVLFGGGYGGYRYGGPDNGPIYGGGFISLVLIILLILLVTGNLGNLRLHG